MHVPDGFAATFDVLKVRGCAYGAIKIGHEKKNYDCSLSLYIECVSGDMERSNMSYSPQRERRKWYIAHYKYVNHGCTESYVMT